MAGPLQPQGRRTVSPGASGLRQINLQAPRGAFGSEQAQALQSAAEGVGNLGDVLEERADAMQERIDKSFAMEVGARLDQFARRKEAEISQLQGKNALGVTEQVTQEINDIGQQALSRTNTERQRRLISNKLSQVKDSLLTKSTNQEVEQQLEYAKSSANAQKEEALRNIRSGGLSSDEVQNAIQTIGSVNQTVISDIGGGAVQEARNQTLEDVSGAFKTRVNTVLQDEENPAKAKRLIRRLGNNMLPEDRNELQGNINSELESIEEDKRQALRNGNHWEVGLKEMRVSGGVETPENVIAGQVFNRVPKNEIQYASPQEEFQAVRAIKQAEEPLDALNNMNNFITIARRRAEQANEKFGFTINPDDAGQSAVDSLIARDDVGAAMRPLLANVENFKKDTRAVEIAVRAAQNPEAFQEVFDALKKSPGSLTVEEGTLSSLIPGVDGGQLTITEEDGRNMQEVAQEVTDSLVANNIAIGGQSGLTADSLERNAKGVEQLVQAQLFDILQNSPNVTKEGMRREVLDRMTNITGKDLQKIDGDLVAVPRETRVGDVLSPPFVEALKRHVVNVANKDRFGVSGEDFTTSRVKMRNDGNTGIAFDITNENGIVEGQAVDGETGEPIQFGFRELQEIGLRAALREQPRSDIAEIPFPEFDIEFSPFGGGPAGISGIGDVGFTTGEIFGVNPRNPLVEGAISLGIIDQLSQERETRIRKRLDALDATGAVADQFVNKFRNEGRQKALEFLNEKIDLPSEQ
jgi:hypothetical protein